MINLQKFKKWADFNEKLSIDKIKKVDLIMIETFDKKIIEAVLRKYAPK